jgi:hypothetical protein
MVTLLSVLFACTGPGADDSDTNTHGQHEGESDNEYYDRVVDELEANRTEFLSDEADELSARGNRLFWLTFPGYDPVLHSMDVAGGGDAVDYDFSIGSDNYNYRGSEEMVVSADPGGDTVTYRAYGIDNPEDLLGSTSFDAPTDGSRWHAYAVDGTTAYIVVTSRVETALYRWSPPADPRRMWSFDELGYDIGEFQDFDVEDGTMIFIESGRIWRADVSNGHGEWLGNPTAISGDVSYDTDGVVWAGDYSLYWYDYVTGGDPVNLTDTINMADYRLNDTYDSAHQIVETGFARVHDHVVYESLSGLYLYDLSTGELDPVVLEDREAGDVRVTWRDPVLLENGVLFATGLESESGSVGADGPVWRIDDPNLLH